MNMNMFAVKMFYKGTEDSFYLFLSILLSKNYPKIVRCPSTKSTRLKVDVFYLFIWFDTSILIMVLKFNTEC